MASRQALEERLGDMIEKDADPDAISALIAQIDALPEDAGPVGKEQDVDEKVTAAQLGLEPTVETPAESQPSEKEQNVSNASISLTKEALGVGGTFTSVLKALDYDTIVSYMIDVEDAEDLMVLGMPEYSQFDSEHRIHVVERGEIRRAARGFAIFAAGGVEAGTITSPNGHIHVVEDAVCYEKVQTQQPDSFSGAMNLIERTSPCLGHKEYRNTGTPDQPRWEATGREFSRCLHQWALMFDAGYFVSFSKGTFFDVIVTEIAQRVGDEDAREQAQAQIAEWRANAAQRHEVRVAFAQTINHVKNQLGLREDEQLPAAPQVLETKLPDGRTLREAILDLKGQQFVVEFQVPVNGELITQRRKAMNLQHAQSVMAPAYAVALLNQTPLKVSAVEAI